MTLLNLARAWINEAFDTQIFVINRKEILTDNNKGCICIKMSLTANDCLYIATGTTFPVEFKLKFRDNTVHRCIVIADTLTSDEIQELAPYAR